MVLTVSLLGSLTLAVMTLQADPPGNVRPLQVNYSTGGPQVQGLFDGIPSGLPQACWRWSSSAAKYLYVQGMAVVIESLCMACSPPHHAGAACGLCSVACRPQLVNVCMIDPNCTTPPNCYQQNHSECVAGGATQCCSECLIGEAPFPSWTWGCVFADFCSGGE